MRLPVSEVVGRKAKLVRAGREYKACCPFHKEKSPSFTVNDQKGFYHCFGCGAHGDIVGFTMRADNRSFPEAVEYLANLAGLPVPQSSPEEAQRYEREKNLYTLIEDAARWFEEQLFTPAGKQALDYARGRGLSDESIARFRLGFAPADGQSLIKMLGTKGYTPQQMVDAGLAKQAENEQRIYSFFRGRLIFPVGDRRGRVVAFGARLLEGDGPKYINSADHSLFHKGQLLYGFSRARAAAADGKPIIITEGYMDVIRLVEAGFVGAVAPLGTALTEEQMQLVWKIIPKPPVRPDLLAHIPVLCFDGDTAGQRAAERALDRILPFLSADQSARFALMPVGEDPDSLIRKKGPQAMQLVLDAAAPLIDFLWRTTAGERPLNTPEDRAGFKRALEARIGTIRDTSLQQDYRQTISKQLQDQFGNAPPAHAQQKFSGSSRFAQKGKRFTYVSVLKPRPLPNNLQERIMLGLLINHPALFHEMEEALHTLPFADADLEKLRSAICDIMAHEQDNEVSSSLMKERLEQEGYGPLLTRLFGSDLFLHAGFVRAERPLELARAGWQDIWNTHLRRSLEDELKNASFEMKNGDDPALMERITHLQSMLAEIEAAVEKAEMQA